MPSQEISFPSTSEVRSDEPDELRGLLGRSPSFQRLKSRLPLLARTKLTVLITGPTGSGKDEVARALHALSSTSSGPYTAVHCAALPDSLVETELFGHSRGAFTGAGQDRAGLIRTTKGGTLFLDEIDSLPLAAQAKLLRFLESGEYRAVGSDKVEHSSARVLAATNQNLNERVRQGLFRSDLMYRLSVVTLEVPSLAARGQDIVALAEHFVHQCTNGEKRLTESAKQALLAYPWPGNVRELKHRVTSAALLTASDSIDCQALDLMPPWTDPFGQTPAAGSGTATLEELLWSFVRDHKMSLAEITDHCEDVLLSRALRESEASRTDAAECLRIHVRTLYKKLARGSGTARGDMPDQAAVAQRS